MRIKSPATVWQQSSKKLALRQANSKNNTAGNGKRKKAKSALTFDVILFALICLSFVSVSLGDKMGMVEYQGKLALRMFAAAYFMVKYLLGLPKYIRFLRGNGLVLLLYIVYALISCSYSVNPFSSVLRAVELLSYICAASIICSNLSRLEDVTKFMQVIYFALGLTLFAVIMTAVMSPKYGYSYLNAYGDMPRLGGRFINPNAVSAYSAILFIGAFSRLLQSSRSSKVWLCYLLLSSGCLYMSKSRSAILAFFACVLPLYLFACYTRHKWIVPRVGIALSILVPVVLAYLDKIHKFVMRGESEALVTSGTGRLTLWATLLQNEFLSNLSNIAFGTGFLTLTDNTQMYAKKATMYMPSAHNAFLQALIGLGSMGLILLFIPTAGGFIHFLRNLLLSKDIEPARDVVNPYPELFFIYLFILMHSLSEAGIGGPPSVILLIFTFLIILSTVKDLVPSKRIRYSQT